MTNILKEEILIRQLLKKNIMLWFNPNLILLKNKTTLREKLMCILMIIHYLFSQKKGDLFQTLRITEILYYQWIWTKFWLKLIYPLKMLVVKILIRYTEMNLKMVFIVLESMDLTMFGKFVEPAFWTKIELNNLDYSLFFMLLDQVEKTFTKLWFLLNPYMKTPLNGIGLIKTVGNILVNQDIINLLL